MLKLERIIGKELLLPGLLVILFASLSLEAPSEAAIVWSDNFDDGNLDGWTISGAKYYSDKASMLAPTGNFSARDKTLRETTRNPTFDDYSLITHPTMTTTGTWSWDLYFNSTAKKPNLSAGVADWVNKPNMELPFEVYGYEIVIKDTGSIVFKRYENGSRIDLAPGNSLEPHQDAWNHIDVTRDSNGRWCLYANGTLVLDFVDNKISEFSYFGFWAQPGPAIDNVVVRDTIYVPPGSLRVTVKDSSGSALVGAAVTSSKQPSGQTVLSGTTTADGTVIFTGVAVGNFTLQVSKSGYVSGQAQGAVASGAKTELSMTLQAQPSSGIPGFPFASVVIGILLCTSMYWLYARKSCAYMANHND